MVSDVGTSYNFFHIAYPLLVYYVILSPYSAACKRRFSYF
jgi:hypothetical protein